MGGKKSEEQHRCESKLETKKHEGWERKDKVHGWITKRGRKGKTCRREEKSGSRTEGLRVI